jgi:hypothetical protein
MQIIIRRIYTDSKYAIGDATLDELLGEEQSRGTGGAVIVNVVYRHTTKTELIHRALAASRIT